MTDVPLSQIAQEWNVHPSNARRYVLKKGFVPKKALDPSRRGQKVLVLSRENADLVRKARREETIAL